MPHVGIEHPGLYELLEWVTGRPEVFDPARARAHVEGGCATCGREAGFLHDLGDALLDEQAYDAFFEGVAAPTVARSYAEEFSAVQGLLAAMERGPAAFREALGVSPSRRALVTAAQLAARLVPRDPSAMLGVAEALAERAAGDAILAGEAALLSAQALTALGRTREAREAVTRARGAFAPGDDGYYAALCDYFEGSAAGFAGDHAGAEELLTRAVAVFREFGQPQWEGRAVAALGTAASLRGDDRAALPLYAAALDLLDPSLDANAWVQTLINRASTLARLGRTGEAHRHYARALSMTLRHGASHQTHMIRVGLAEIEFRRGEWAPALVSWRKLAAAAAASGWEEDVLLAHLYEAECLGRLGRDDEMRTAIAALRRGPGGAPGETPLEDLFACLDSGDLEAGSVAHVREFLERPAGAAYVPIPRRGTGR